MTRGVHPHKHKPLVNGMNDPWTCASLADDKGTIDSTAGQELIRPGILNRVQLCAFITRHRPLSNPSDKFLHGDG